MQEFVPPPPPPPVTLPVNEDFDDGLAELFSIQTGAWNVEGGEYRAAHIAGSDAVSTLEVTGALPADLEVRTNFNAEASGVQQNGFIVFDYQSPTDFKYAGAFVGTNRWAIGSRTAAGWVDDQTFVQTINSGTEYQLQMVVRNDRDVSLRVNDVELVVHSFSDVVTDGAIGLATRAATSRFDDFLAQDFVPPPPPSPTPLPFSEDFDDGTADLFVSQVGGWTVSAGRYHAAPIAGSDAVSTLELTATLPADVELQATVLAKAGGVQQNVFVVFDYQSPTEFKYAGGFVGTDRWAIGRRTTAGWVDDQTFNQPIDTSTDYQLQLVIENDQDVRLLVDGTEFVSHTYADSLTDGALGLAARNAQSQFDDVLVQDFVALPPPPPTTLPISEDFQDGVADLFGLQSGEWDVQGGRYHGASVAGSDAISTLQLNGPLPDDLQLASHLNGARISS